MPRPLLYQYLSFSLFSSLFLSLCFLCKGLPLKDENGHEHEHKHEHEPLVQARQHRTAIANGMSSGGMGGVGIRHHGGARMSPLEIGMYVLLAAFCFAIVVFVVSCVVYASKFKPQPPDSPLAGSALPVLSGAARARAAANQLASGRRPPRESTTNAHDWVWLGRATLERAACGPQQVLLISDTIATDNVSRMNSRGRREERIPSPFHRFQVRVTSNPLAGENEGGEGGELATCFDNPNHIELPSAGQRSNGSNGPIDTTTYCKRDKMPRNSFVTKQVSKPSTVVSATTIPTPPSMLTSAVTSARNE